MILVVRAVRGRLHPRGTVGHSPGPSVESVQQSHVLSQFAFRDFNLQIVMQIGAQMRRTCKAETIASLRFVDCCEFSVYIFTVKT